MKVLTLVDHLFCLFFTLLDIRERQVRTTPIRFVSQLVDGEFTEDHRSSPTISSKFRFLLVSALSIKLTPIELGSSDCDRTCAALS